MMVILQKKFHRLCFVVLFMMELADTSSLKIIAFQLSGSRCEHTMAAPSASREAQRGF